ncbi:YHS domain-containing (seleno)protein [Winogradskyella sp. UBA3174]|uniref:YHS domain-containing (seleno)protein n=1 Tax=Winogradskyella sp. UBA3174 TaxID=1947785 RepID=UPI0025CEE2BD|nr:YHS domain-containing (seleno)protein [Winogradskyella sp. UBA3174]|tara:strand:+ start:4283 stop:4723 length:441 start_codon:yes stop_codon:yes gene_type:complete
MKYIIIFFISITYGFAQNLDYNTKKGFAAEGYDVVAYFNNEALEGSKKFTTKFDRINYKFNSQKNLDAFEKNPKAFIPQYGGYCAYAVAKSSKKVSINPETFEIRDGKLYLFYNSWGNNTLEKWKKENVKGLQEKGDLNWEAVKFD